MTKLLIDASSLQEMLKRNPEVEIELVKNAAAQIAEVFKRKTLDNSEVLVSGLIEQINSRLNYKYHLPDVVLKVIKSACEDHIKVLDQKYADQQAKRCFDNALAVYTKRLEKDLDSMISTAVEKKVAAVFAAAARLK